MARLKATRRTLAMGVAAVVLTALVIADYWGGSSTNPMRGRPAAIVAPTASAPISPVAPVAPVATGAAVGTPAITPSVNSAVNPAPATAAPAVSVLNATAGSPAARLAALRGALAAGPQIDAAYQKIAASYAERVALVPGYSIGREDPARAVERAIRESIPPGVELTDLVLGTPRQAHVGAYAFSATVRLRSGNHRAMIEALISLANPDSGFLWERLDLTAEPEARTLSATGQLAALVIEAAE